MKKPKFTHPNIQELYWLKKNPDAMIKRSQRLRVCRKCEKWIDDSLVCKDWCNKGYAYLDVAYYTIDYDYLDDE